MIIIVCQGVLENFFIFWYNTACEVIINGKQDIRNDRNKSNERIQRKTPGTSRLRRKISCQPCKTCLRTIPWQYRNRQKPIKKIKGCKALLYFYRSSNKILNILYNWHWRTHSLAHARRICDRRSVAPFVRYVPITPPARRASGVQNANFVWRTITEILGYCSQKWIVTLILRKQVFFGCCRGLAFPVTMHVSSVYVRNLKWRVLPPWYTAGVSRSEAGNFQWKYHP